MASMANINRLISLLEKELGRPIINTEKCILRLGQLSELVHALDYERVRTHQAESRKEDEAKELRLQVKELEPIKQSLNILTAHNGKLLRKIKRLENKAQGKRG